MISIGLRRLRDELGLPGQIALALLAAGALFLLFVVKPLETRTELLAEELGRSARQGASPNPGFARASTAEAKLVAFYRFFETEEETTDLLARLYGIGTAVGVELHSAEYRMEATGTRVRRYRIVLPLTGSYAQIRAFLKNALIEIPVLSLDQISIKRERAGDALVRAEASLTLHLTERPGRSMRTPEGTPEPQRLALPGTVDLRRLESAPGSSRE